MQMSVLLGVVGLGLMGLGAGLGANLDPAEEHESSDTGGAVGEEVWRGQGAALAFEARYRRDMREWLDSLSSDEAQDDKGGRVRRRRQRRAGGVWRGAVLNCVVVTLLAAGWALVLRTILLGTIPTPSTTQAAAQAATQALHEGVQVLQEAAEVVEPLVGLDKGAVIGGAGVVSWLPEGVLVGGAVGVAVQAVLQGRRAIAHMAHAHAGKRQDSRDLNQAGSRRPDSTSTGAETSLLLSPLCLVQGCAVPSSRARLRVKWARRGGRSRGRRRTG